MEHAQNSVEKERSPLLSVDAEADIDGAEEPIAPRNSNGATQSSPQLHSPARIDLRASSPYHRLPHSPLELERDSHGRAERESPLSSTGLPDTPSSGSAFDFGGGRRDSEPAEIKLQSLSHLASPSRRRGGSGNGDTSSYTNNNSSNSNSASRGFNSTKMSSDYKGELYAPASNSPYESTVYVSTDSDDPSVDHYSSNPQISIPLKNNSSSNNSGRSSKKGNSSKDSSMRSRMNIMSPFGNLPSLPHGGAGGEEPDCQCCCLRCVCNRCLTHCWFLFVCCGFLFISSLPRISVVIDLLTTVLMYLFDTRPESMSVGEFLKHEFTHYDFRASSVSVVILSILRAAILFYCFAYRFHTNYYAFWISTITCAISATYVTVKLIVCTNSAVISLLVFSLTIIVAEYGIYILVRRQRIVIPRRPERSRLLMGSNKSESYHSLPDRSPSVPSITPIAVDGVPPESLAEPDSLFLSIDRLKIHYKREGSLNRNHGHAIILLHGFGGSAYSWKRVMKEMAQDNLVIAFDRPGFGLTSRPLNGDWAENPYTTHFSATLVTRIMDALSLKTAILIGHSSGGAVAVLSALNNPERIKGLILVSPTIFTEGFPQLVRSLFRTRLGKELVRQLVRTEIGEVALRRAWRHPERIPEDIIQNYKRTLKVAGWHEALMELTNVPPIKLTSRLQNLTVPVVIIHGDEDKLVPLNESKNVVSELSLNHTADLIVLEDNGHVPHEETPQLFVQHARNFLKTHFQGSAP